jgi:hypothetical protein
VTEGVIDLLEPVQVEEQDRSGRTVATGVAQRRICPFVEIRPVGQAGEIVVHGLMQRVGHRLVHGAHGAGVIEGETGMLGERDKDVAFGLGVRPTLATGSDGQAADRATFEMDRGGHRRVQAVVRELRVGTFPVLVDLGETHLVFENRPATYAAAEGHTTELPVRSGWQTHRRRDDQEGGVGLVEEAQAHRFVVQQLGGPKRDGIEGALEWRTGGDPALDTGQPLEKYLTLTEQGDESPVLLRRPPLQRHDSE